MRESEASIRGRVMRDLIAHVTNDHLIGKKIKNGELRKKIGDSDPQSGQRSVSSDISTLQFLHLLIIYSITLYFYRNPVRGYFPEKSTLHRRIDKIITETEYKCIPVRADRSFQMLPL